MSSSLKDDQATPRRGYRLTERQLGQILVDQGYLTDTQLKVAVDQHDRTKERLGRLLVRLGSIQEPELVKALAHQLGLVVASAESLATADSEALNLIPESVAREAQALPLRREGDTLVVAVADPLNVLALDSLQKTCKLAIRPQVAVASDVLQAIDRYYRERRAVSDASEILESLQTSHDGGDGEVDLEALRAAIDDAPVVRFVNLILSQAIEERASDIHIESLPDAVLVRYRIDGVLHEAHRPPKSLQMALISRIKVLSDLDIAVRLAPQDGRFSVTAGSHTVDVRVSTLPTVFGEKVVLRLFDKSAFERRMTNIGIVGEEAVKVERTIRRPYGMILLSGPTGSGKSTTLYSFLNEIKTPTRNLLTVEDPVEYHVDGVNQVAANPRVGLSFASALRAFLRQDPDVIMVGEIRDLETAEIAIKCALTGHLVLSTIHANDSPSTLTRMVDIGVPRYLVSSAVHMVIAQRLVRRVCPSCAEPMQADPAVMAAFGESAPLLEGHTFLHGKGCVNCRKTGYRGRTGLFEVLEMTQPVRKMLIAGSDDQPLRAKALELGMVGLREAGIRKALAGETTLEEVLSATLSEE